MDINLGGNIGHFMAGEFVDGTPSVSSPPSQAPPMAVGENVRARLIGEFVDTWPGEAANHVLKDFTVLLRDNRTVQVRGNSLKHLRQPSDPDNGGTYAILRREGREDLTVALFPASEVTGIFPGAVASPSK